MNIPPKMPSRRRAVVAMLLGTALTAFSTPVSAHAEQAQDGTIRIVNDMSRYCTVCWRNARLHPDYWGDCTQEVFSRMLQRVSPAAWHQALRGEGEERREFLRAIDAVKKRTQRALRRSTALNEVVADERDDHERYLADERDAVRRAAAELLSPRQQRILQLSFDGWSVQEIANEMEVAAERVSDEKYKAIRKLRAYFFNSCG
jgi:RNA polymerase sigma factor (sigma-70 family)